MINLRDDDDTLPPVQQLPVVVKPRQKRPKNKDEPPPVVVELPEKVDSEPEVVYRSRQTGQRINAAEWHEQQGLTKVAKAKKARLTESQLPHGGGLVQKKEQELGERHAQEILAGGFHRSEIQTSLDEELRSRQREEDPMKQFLTKPAGPTKGVVKERCKFVAPPNRFGIKAGSQWDGRVRGTGFEEKYLKALQAVSAGDHQTTLLEEDDD